jgi:hypothetical protein
MLLLLIGVSYSTFEDDTNTTIVVPLANISQINDSLVNYFTQTIVAFVDTSEIATQGTTVFPGEQNSRVGTYIIHTHVVRYVPTLYLILKAVENAPAATADIIPPTQSIPLKSFFFAPAYLLGILGGVLFVGGAFYTYRCYNPRRITKAKSTKSAHSSRRRRRSSDSLSSGSGSGPGRAARQKVYPKAAGKGGGAKAKRARV